MAVGFFVDIFGIRNSNVIALMLDTSEMMIDDDDHDDDVRFCDAKSAYALNDWKGKDVHL